MLAGQRTAYCARDMVTLLRRETLEFISPDLWPANSPDLNPVDHKSWGVMQESVYHMPILDVIQQKQRLIEVWSGIQQNVMEEAIDQWRKTTSCLCSSQWSGPTL